MRIKMIFWIVHCSLFHGWAFFCWFSLEQDWYSTMIMKRNDTLKVDYYGELDICIVVKNLRYDTRYDTHYNTFFMEIDTYHHPYLILKWSLQHLYNTRYDTWYYNTMIHTSSTISIIFLKIKLIVFLLKDLLY